MNRNRVFDFENMSDDEFDAFFAERKTNSIKSLLPLYVYLILENHSDAAKHLTQKQILTILEERYGVEMERKALSRCLHALTDADVGIFSNPRCGAWMQR